MQLTCAWKEGLNMWSIALSSHKDGCVIKSTPRVPKTRDATTSWAFIEKW